jgi:hypothetical protein
MNVSFRSYEPICVLFYTIYTTLNENQSEFLDSFRLKRSGFHGKRSIIATYTISDFTSQRGHSRMDVGMANVQLQLPSNPLARITQRDVSARQVLSTLATTPPLLPVQIGTVAVPMTEEYTQIDPGLSVAQGDATQHPPLPTSGLGYAGLTPTQRQHFLTWLDDPIAPAPPLFQQLYLAYLEIALLEGGRHGQQARQELRRLVDGPAWQAAEGLARTALFACWLAQDGQGLAEWITLLQPPSPLVGLALGWQALCTVALTVDEAMSLFDHWQITETPPTAAVLTLRLNSLTTNLGADPLSYALKQVDATALAPRAWRAQHRDLRLALPQPDLRPILEPLLAELVAVMDVEEQPTTVASHGSVTRSEATTGAADLGWHLVLEFGHSRSDLFTFALTIAQRLPSFVQILDENRKLIYRVVFKKNEMRSFWRLWDYVQSWSSTHVYLNGVEVEKWKVYPYSQFLR